MAEETGNPLSETIDMVKAYAIQETVTPLKSLGGYLKFGVPGGLFAGLGMMFLTLGVLRFMQRRGSWVTGSLTWIPYLVTILFGAVVLGAFALLIKRSNK